MAIAISDTWVTTVKTVLHGNEKWMLGCCSCLPAAATRNGRNAARSWGPRPRTRSPRPGRGPLLSVACLSPSWFGQSKGHGKYLNYKHGQTDLRLPKTNQLLLIFTSDASFLVLSQQVWKSLQLQSLKPGSYQTVTFWQLLESAPEIKTVRKKGLTRLKTQLLWVLWAHFNCELRASSMDSKI